MGLGCDLVPVGRLRAGCERRPALLARLFSPEELEGAAAYAGDRRWERLAGIFAAKEATLKALGTGMAVPFRDVEVTHDGAGRPGLLLSGAAAAAAARLGARRWLLSISHSGGFALAMAVAEDGAA